MSREDDPVEQSSETTPLLSTETRQEPDSSDRTESSSVKPTEGSDGEIEQNVDAAERQPVEDRNKYEGMPEVRKKLKYIMPALAIGIYLGAADQTIIITLYGAIGNDLKALNRTSWIATAYFLTLTACQPLVGKLSDIFGRKGCLLTGYAIFGLGCLCCGLAQNINHLIIARAIAGIGAAGNNTVVSILLSDIMTLRERGKWQGYLNILFATGASSGGPLGGLLVKYVGWRWAFLGQVPLCLAAFIAVLLMLNMSKKDDTHWKQKLGRIDFLGAIVLIAAVFSLLLALDRGSNVSWSATITIVSLSVSSPLFILFVAVETKVAKEPFAPGHVIFSRNMFPNYLCYFFMTAGYLSTLFYIPLYLQAYNGFSPIEAGFSLIPTVLVGTAGSLGAGIYMQKTGRYYWLAVVSYSVAVLGIAAVFLYSGMVTYSAIGVIIALCLTGLGSGLAGTINLIALIANAEREDQAVTTACSYLFRSLGSVFGISMSATVANQTLRKLLASELPSLGLPEKEAIGIADGVRQSLESLQKLEPDVRAIVIDCYAKSVNAAFGLQIAFIVGAFVSVWFIKEKALSK